MTPSILTPWQLDKAQAEAERDFRAGTLSRSRMESGRQRDRVYTREARRLLQEQAEAAEADAERRRAIQEDWAKAGGLPAIADIPKEADNV